MEHDSVNKVICADAMDTIINKFVKQIAVSTRLAQREAEDVAGPGVAKHIFQLADHLISHAVAWNPLED